jgi:hypothetical protein
MGTELSIHSSSRIHERTILLWFLNTSLKVLRLEVSVYNVYITNQLKTTFVQEFDFRVYVAGCCTERRRNRFLVEAQTLIDRMSK